MGSTLFETGEIVSRSALLSECGRYRYTLGRKWSGGRLVNFLMYNPSTADAAIDDPTIRRCVGFARAWGFGELVVTNLFALRSTDPKAILATPCGEAVGPENNRRIVSAAVAADLIVCAWGSMWTGGRCVEVLRDLRGAGLRPHAIRLTKQGHPSHPLYLPGDLRPSPMEAAR